MFAIITTRHFLRRVTRFLRKHPELRDRFSRVVDDLKADPFAPDLNYHHLRGDMKGLQAISLTYEYRIVLTIMLTEKEIILLDIGSHDEVYG